MLKEFKRGDETFFNVTVERLLEIGVDQSEIDAALKTQGDEEVLFHRRLAYKAESDPLYMEWQYDQTAEKEQSWRDKVAEIKARYPLPSEA
ncbi:hypothetical protein MYC06_004701 [Vibrio parahaemolyticus]|nr:hypothetical protein [Vibrio parahaemolyticus]EJC7066867.1 hypothetical protein [Vibrio parahaemolyticus]